MAGLKTDYQALEFTRVTLSRIASQFDDTRSQQDHYDLRVLRHFTDESGNPDPEDGTPPEIYAGLSYAWRSEQYETDLRLFTATPDLGRLQ